MKFDVQAIGEKLIFVQQRSVAIITLSIYALL